MKSELIIITGEDSGDLYGGNLTKELYKLSPDLKISGVGGRHMRSAGVDIFCDVADIAVVGITEVIEKISILYRVYRNIISKLNTGNIRGVVLIDFPDFNLMVARAAKKRGIPVFYYVSPQVWAWRKGRIKTIKRYVDKMMVILPFEKEFYKREGVDVEFVGHPLLEVIPSPLQGGVWGKEEICRELGVDDRELIIGILPGSRKKEIAYMLPTLLEASSIIKERYPSSQFLLPLSQSISEEDLPRPIHFDPTTGWVPRAPSSFARRGWAPVAVKHCNGKRVVKKSDYSYIKVVQGKNYDVMKVSDLIITKSGTATLEAAIIGTPMIIIYKASILSFSLAKYMVNVPFAGLPNLLAGKEVAPELLQFKAKAKNIAEKVLSLLEEKSCNEKGINNELSQMRDELKHIKYSLGEPGASRRAATIIIEYLKNNSS